MCHVTKRTARYLALPLALRAISFHLYLLRNSSNIPNVTSRRYTIPLVKYFFRILKCSLNQLGGYFSMESFLQIHCVRDYIWNQSLLSVYKRTALSLAIQMNHFISGTSQFACNSSKRYSCEQRVLIRQCLFEGVEDS